MDEKTEVVVVLLNEQVDYLLNLLTQNSTKEEAIIERLGKAQLEVIEEENSIEEEEDDEDWDDEEDYEWAGEENENRIMFADPGGNSALRAASRDNPRNRPCPTCKRPNLLTPADVSLGYQCDRCADRAERGGDY